MKTIICIRHGESNFNFISRRFRENTPSTGLEDPALTLTGINQAFSLNVDSEIIITSPLQRAVQTALLLKKNQKIIASALCRERITVHGDYGNTVDKMSKLYPNIDFSELPAEIWWHDETPAMIAERAQLFRNYLSNLPYNKIIVVSHYGFLKEFTNNDLKNCEVKIINI